MPRDKDDSPIAPLRQPVFRMLWITWLMANISMWMNDVAAAWLMTTFGVAPIWVALVQTASTLPVFLLGLPSGALADSLDRKRYLLATQLWVALVATVLSGLLFLDIMSPLLLLALAFANGIGLAMRWPVFSAIVPELVPSQQLPAALALNAVSMNASRIVGPMAAGALIAMAGSAWVFLLNAVMSLIAAIVIGRWKREHKPPALGRERLSSAMRVGLQYVMQSYQLRGILLRVSIFFFHSTALTALLALVAQGMQGGGAGTFTLLLASMGAGAIASTALLPRLRRRYSRDGLVMRGTVALGLAVTTVALTDRVWLAVPAMLLAGASWISTANTLSVFIQMGLPDWVRARGMSIFMMCIMGASAAGATLWGLVATWSNVPTSLVVAAASGVAVMALAIRLLPDTGQKEDLTPKPVYPVPETSIPSGSGQVMVTIEYQIDPAKTSEFRHLMLEEGRRNRLRHGARSWELLHDVSQPGRFVEVVVDDSWVDHLRRFDRVTTSDISLRDRKRAFHLGDEPPRVSRYLMETHNKSS